MNLLGGALPVPPAGGVMLQVTGGGPVGPYGIIAIIVVLQLLGVVSAARGRLRLVPKVLWILAIVFLPLVGVVLYFFLGRTHR